ncbi:porin family protein [Chitinophaga lutea]
MVKILYQRVLWKSFALAFVMAAFAGSAKAQSTLSDKVSGKIGRKVRFGFKLDPGASMMRPQEDGVTRNSGRFYFSYGVLADFFLDESGNYAIASGLQVSAMGSTLQYEAGKGLATFKSAVSEYDLRMTYVEVPFTLKLKTDIDNGLGIWGQFGGFAGFPVRARGTVISGTTKFEKQDLLRDMNPLNAGMIIGAGVEIPLTETLAGVVGFNYQNGFIDVTRNGKWDDGRVNMNNFTVRLGVYF